MGKKDHIQLVFKYYRPGLFDERQAVEQLHGRGVGMQSGRRPGLVWGLAFAVIAVLGIVAGVTLHQVSVNRWEEVMASVFELPDGSVVQLRDGASLSYQPRRFARERIVRLNGTGYFEVMHNPTAPFEVLARASFVRVLGTRFVYDAEQGEVYVLEGRVQFAGISSGQGLVLSQGEYAVLPEGVGQPVLTSTKQPNPAAWATGRLAYEAVPLGTVLEELSAVYGRPLRVVPESASGKCLTGKFRVSDGLEFIISTVEAAMNVLIETTDE